MRIETNAANRKDVVKAVSGILGQPSKYMGVPTCSYQIGNCTIDRSGAVETEDEKTAELVRAGLLEQGLIETPHTEADETTVSIPVEGMSAEGLKNLIFLTHSKQMRSVRRGPRFCGRCFPGSDSIGGGAGQHGDSRCGNFPADIPKPCGRVQGHQLSGREDYLHPSHGG